jgi:hypothetical protein
MPVVGRRTTYLDDEWRVARGQPSDAVFLFNRTRDDAEAEAEAGTGVLQLPAPVGTQ